MSTATHTTDVEVPRADDEFHDVPEVSVDEGRAWLDDAARLYLGVDRETFLLRYEAGEYADREDVGYHRVAGLVAFGR